MTSPAIGVDDADTLADCAPIHRSALGPGFNDQGFDVGRVERNLYWINDATHASALPTCGTGDYRQPDHRRALQEPADSRHLHGWWERGTRRPTQRSAYARAAHLVPVIFTTRGKGNSSNAG